MATKRRAIGFVDIFTLYKQEIYLNSKSIGNKSLPERVILHGIIDLEKADFLYIYDEMHLILAELEIWMSHKRQRSE